MHPETDKSANAAIEATIREHLAVLGHCGYGVSELRIFDPLPQVAYADSEDAAVRLSLAMDGRTCGIYIGVQSRPIHLFDCAPNRWVAARGGPDGNCARDSDIEYITAVFFDIDVVSPARLDGCPASEEELKDSLQAAELLSRQDGLAGNSTICCSGNGHYVLAPLIPVAIDSPQVAGQFRSFCRGLADGVAGQITGARIDPVYNLSRVMRVIGTWNNKGKPQGERPHRRARFVTPAPPFRSIALHYMILNADDSRAAVVQQEVPTALRCRLDRIEQCEFIQWCRRHPQAVSEPQWFALITNLAHLKDGAGLVHEISARDGVRYDYADTQRMIERILREGYKPVSCKTIMSPAMARPGRGMFRCSRIARCPARAPMYLAASHTVYTR